jgi:hypothetical protein
MIVKAKRTAIFGKTLAISTVDAPLPHPTSATHAPASSLACTPCRENPRTDEVCGIARPEEFLAAMKHIFIVLIATHAGAGSESLGNPGNSGQRAESQLEDAGKICGTIFVRQRK